MTQSTCKKCENPTSTCALGSTCGCPCHIQPQEEKPAVCEEYITITDLDADTTGGTVSRGKCGVKLPCHLHPPQEATKSGWETSQPMNAIKSLASPATHREVILFIRNQKALSYREGITATAQEFLKLNWETDHDTARDIVEAKIDALTQEKEL